MEIAEVALLFSAIALIVSTISLWVNSLTPFSLSVTHDTPTLAIYEITPSMFGSESGKTWWIPSFNIGFSFLNTGKRPGKILDIRIVADLAEPRSHKRYVFYPKWLVDYSRFQKDRTKRFQWIHEAVLRDLYSLSLGGQKDAHIHLILEAERWNEKFQGEMRCRLQIMSSQKREWVDLGEYNLPITEKMFEEKSSYSPYDRKREEIREL